MRDGHGFITERLQITNWDKVLGDCARRERLIGQLAPILTEPVLRHLPESFQVSSDAPNLDEWIFARATESEVMTISFRPAGIKLDSLSPDNSTTRNPTLNNRAIDNQSLDNKSMDNQSLDNKSMDNKSMDNQTLETELLGLLFLSIHIPPIHMLSNHATPQEDDNEKANDVERKVYLGYLLAESAWGKGYASELIAGLIKYFASDGKSTQLIGGVEPVNVASARVLQKNGFVKSAKLSDSTTNMYSLKIHA